jgi:hypothetical protein
MAALQLRGEHLQQVLNADILGHANPAHNLAALDPLEVQADTHK